ncbi:class I SAM-dependent methyltransferase [Desulforhopalus sp. 52FAK]
MTNSPIKTYKDIDWATLRRNAMAQKGWKRKGPKEWDQKAKSFSGRTKHNDYVDLFISELPLAPSLTVIDIGSGPGTLSLPIAKLVKSVTALDFSEGMLEILDQHAAAEGLTNINTVECSWEDDWQEKGIPPHDIAIASRSVGVEELQAALTKINNIATKFVFISDRIGATPFEADAFHAIGRPFESGPDYIYTLNLLYTMGIYPNVTVLRPDPVSHYSSVNKAFESYCWMFQELSTREETKLRDYIQQNIIQTSPDGTISVKRNSPVQWALIWWQKQ